MKRKNLPFLAALCKAAPEVLSIAGSAPLSMRYWTIAVWPCLAALRTGVSPTKK